MLFKCPLTLPAVAQWMEQNVAAVSQHGYLAQEKYTSPWQYFRLLLCKKYLATVKLSDLTSFSVFISHSNGAIQKLFSVIILTRR